MTAERQAVPGECEALAGRWENIGSAPRGNDPILVRTEGGYELRARYIEGFLNDAEEECGGWVAEDEGCHPDDWCDGVCWGSNSDEVPSDPPIAWLNPAHLDTIETAA